MQPTEPVIRRYHFDIFADYHQVYLEDCQLMEEEIAGLVYDPAETAEQFAARMQRLEQSDERITSFFTPEAQARHLGIAHGTLCIHTARYVEVPVRVEVRDTPELVDWTGWDFVVEASLDVPSGCLVIHGPAGELEDPHIALAPGTYRARVYYGGIATVSGDALEGADHYLVMLWPAPSAQPIVLHAGITGAW